MNPVEHVTVENIRKAADRIQSHVRVTPLEPSHYYSELSGANVYFKLENLQVTGAFKVRGALNTLSQLPDEAFDKGVVTVSAGNHALGFGYSCKVLGRDGRIILPKNASPAKIAALKQFPTSVEFRGDTYDEAEEFTLNMVSEKGGFFVSPYNDVNIVCGQGTAGLEIHAALPECDAILVPVGGGGLIAGISAAYSALNPKVKFYGVQSEASPVAKKSLDAGEIVEAPLSDSIAEGLHGRIEPGAVTFQIMKEYVDDVLLVSEEEIKSEFAPYIQNHHNLLEGSSAVVPAAIRKYRHLFEGRTVAGLITGANIDVKVLADLILKYG